MDKIFIIFFYSVCTQNDRPEHTVSTLKIGLKNGPVWAEIFETYIRHFLISDLFENADPPLLDQIQTFFSLMAEGPPFPQTDILKGV